MITPWRMGWTRHLSLILKPRTECRILARKSEGKVPLETPRHMWVNYIKMDLRELG
jgi:hypothetical protein